MNTIAINLRPAPLFQRGVVQWAKKIVQAHMPIPIPMQMNVS